MILKRAKDFITTAMLYENVSSKKFPQQCSARLLRRVYVVFHDNLSDKLGGQLVRCDEEMPFVTIIKLDDGRYVLDSECLFEYENLSSPTVD